MGTVKHVYGTIVAKFVPKPSKLSVRKNIPTVIIMFGQDQSLFASNIILSCQY